MQNIVKDYNDVIKYINQNNNYDDQKNIADSFFCNETIEDVQNKLSNLFVGTYGGSNSQYSSLANLGITLNKDGSLEFDSSTFLNALNNNFKDVKKTLVETSTGAEDGFLSMMHSDINQMTGSNGELELEKGYINDRVDSLDTQIDTIQKQLDQERMMLTLTFSQMDEYIGGLKSQSSYMQQVFDSMNKK